MVGGRAGVVFDGTWEVMSITLEVEETGRRLKEGNGGG
jgi:hypothetical protein